MKKFYLALVVSILCCNLSYCSDSDYEPLEGLSFKAKSGFSIQMAKNNKHDHNALLWKVEGDLKYQKKGEFYFRGLGSYAFGKKTKETIDHRHYKLNGELAFGFTFKGSHKNAISPFFAVGYDNFKEKRSDPHIGKSTDKEIWNIRFHGVYGIVGLDTVYWFSSNFSAGLILAGGIHFNPKVKYKDIIEHEDKTTQANKELNYDATRKPFFKASLPMNYRVDNFILGLEIFYRYMNIKVKSEDVDVLHKKIIDTKLHNVGLFLTLGWFF